MSKSEPTGLWLINRHYDLSFFVLPAFLGLLWLVPFYIYGPAAIFFIYVGQSLVAGIPHLYVTWFSLASKEALQNIQTRFVYGVGLAALVGTALIILYVGEWISNFLISLTFFLAGWHSHKQHLGMIKLYTYVQSERWQDSTIIEDTKALRWFYFFAMNVLFIFSFTRPEITYQITAQRNISLIYPKMPIELLYAYVSLTVLIGLWALYRIFYVRRLVNKKPLPWPQLCLAATTVSVATFMYLTLPPKAYMLLWIVPAFGHNIQYMAYVWLFERLRVRHIEKASQKPFPFSRLLKIVKNRRWFFYFFPAYLLTVFSLSLGSFGYELMAVALIHFITIFHYIGDGFFWKKDINQHAKPVTRLILNYGSDSSISPKSPA